MKKKFIMQDGSKDCGVTCLYNIIKYYGGNINIYKLRNMLNTSKNGTSIYDIVKTSNALGLITNAYRCELNDLCSINYPSIAHIKIDGKYDHFIIIQNIIDDEILIFDPIRGYLKYDLEDFEKEWTNNIITFEKTDNLIKEKTYYFITSYIKKNIFMIFLIVFLSIFTTLLSILNSFYLSYLYDNPFISYKIFPSKIA